MTAPVSPLAYEPAHAEPHHRDPAVAIPAIPCTGCAAGSSDAWTHDSPACVRFGWEGLADTERPAGDAWVLLAGDPEPWPHPSTYERGCAGGGW